jgi:predicted NBD/HSP70 family sugar kinase
MLVVVETIGIDVGGTKVLGVALDPTRPDVVRAEQRVPTPDGGDGLVEALLAVVAGLCPPPPGWGWGCPVWSIITAPCGWVLISGASTMSASPRF